MSAESDQETAVYEIEQQVENTIDQLRDPGIAVEKLPDECPEVGLSQSPVMNGIRIRANMRSNNRGPP
jgi:hypothetical protein